MRLDDVIQRNPALLEQSTEPAEGLKRQGDVRMCSPRVVRRFGLKAG